MKHVKLFEKWTDKESLKDYSIFVQQHFVKLSGIVKLCHWRVKDYTNDEIWGQLYDMLSYKMDGLVESIMGSNILKPNSDLLEYEAFRNYEFTDVELILSEPNEFLKNLIIFLESLKEDKTITNIIDEMISDINEIAYKLNLE